MSKLYEFYKGVEVVERGPLVGTEPKLLLDLVGTNHQYLSTGIVIFHTVELNESPVGEPTTAVYEEKRLEQEHFIPYHSFDRIEITNVEDNSDVPF